MTTYLLAAQCSLMLLGLIVWLAKRNATAGDRAYNDARTDVKMLRTAEMGFARMVDELKSEVTRLSGRLDHEQTERRLDREKCAADNAACLAREVELKAENTSQSALIRGLQSEVADLWATVKSGGVVP